MRKKIIAIALVSGIAFPSYGAMSVFDGTLIAVVKTNFQATLVAITTMQTAIVTQLQNVGMAVNQNGSKVATTIEAASKAERDLSIEMQRTTEIQNARRTYQVPASICSESASGGAIAIGNGSSGAKGSFRPGGGASAANTAIANVVNKPAVAPAADAARAASVHAAYCDADDYAAFGGSDACPSINTSMPGADKRLDSVLTGAGKDGKDPDLTFSQEQTDVARMYIQNSTRRSIGKALSKSEAQSTAGTQYIGLQTQLNSTLSAASAPQEQALADRQPRPETKDLLAEALKAPSAATFFNETASKQAKSTGMMSQAEFEQFEVGRRYANTAYNTDLQNLDDSNLLRESIRTQALQNWLLLSIKNELVKGNILAGQQLASQARSEYGSILEQKYQAIGAKLGGN